MMFHESKTGMFAAAAVMLSAVCVSDAITMDDARPGLKRCDDHIGRDLFHNAMNDAQKQQVPGQGDAITTDEAHDPPDQQVQGEDDDYAIFFASQAFQNVLSEDDVLLTRRQESSHKTVFTILTKQNSVLHFERPTRRKGRSGFSRLSRPDEIDLTSRFQLPKDEKFKHWGALLGHQTMERQFDTHHTFHHGKHRATAGIEIFCGDHFLILTDKKLHVFDDNLSHKQQTIALADCDLNFQDATIKVSGWSFTHTYANKIVEWQNQLQPVVQNAINLKNFEMSQQPRQEKLKGLGYK